MPTEVRAPGDSEKNRTLTDSGAPNRRVTAGRSLFRRCEIWAPTLKGWLVIALVLLLSGALAVVGLHPFLAVSNPFPDGPLTMEGWLDGSAIPVIEPEFRKRGYPVVYVTGGPIDRASVLGDQYATFAELGAAGLRRFHLPIERIEPVPAPYTLRDRTYTSAVFLRRWLIDHHALPTHLTVITAGTHARRTRLLFQKAFGHETEVAVLSVPDTGFDPHRWWVSSEGFRTVVSEAIAYVYARLFFWPRNEAE